jgi:single-stranded DNA-binding protein
MNNLNSVLVEGVILETQEYSESEKRCAFTIESNRYYKTADGSNRKKASIFTVVVTGEIAEVCSKKNKGLGVRVVGRIDTAENNAVFIQAEHIEYRPEKSGKGA